MNYIQLAVSVDFSLILILISGVLQLKTLSLKEYILLLNTATIFCFDIWAAKLALQKIDNGHVYYYLLFFETSFYVWYLWLIIGNKLAKRYMLLGYFALILVWGLNLLQNPKPSSFAFFFMLQAALLATFFIYYLIYNQGKERFFKSPTNCIALGSVIYFCGSIPFHALYDYLINSHLELHRKLFVYINLSLSHLRYILIFCAFLLLFIQHRKEKKALLAHE